MHTLTLEAEPLARDVRFSEESFTVELEDGRHLSVPLSWFPRLLNGTPEQRADWHLIGRGQGLHWEQLNEDISVTGLLAGRRSVRRQSIS